MLIYFDAKALGIRAARFRILWSSDNIFFQQGEHPSFSERFQKNMQSNLKYLPGNSKQVDNIICN